MKKNVYLTIITIITVLCIICGTCYNILGMFKHSDKQNEAYTNDRVVTDTFKNLIIDTNIVDVEIIPGSEYSYTINSDKKYTPSVLITDNTLSVTQNISGINNLFGISLGGNVSCKMQITVPDNAVLSDVRITSNVGDINIGSISSKNTSISTNVGDIDVNSLHCPNIKITSDIGDVCLSDIKNIYLYNINTSTSLGTVSFMGESFGTGFNKTLTNPENYIDIENNVGDIKIK